MQHILIAEIWLRAISDKILKDRAINLKYNGYQRRLVSMVYKFFWQKKVSEASVNEVLGQQLHKKLIKKFKIRKVHARFKDNV